MLPADLDAFVPESLAVFALWSLMVAYLVAFAGIAAAARPPWVRWLAAVVQLAGLVVPLAPYAMFAASAPEYGALYATASVLRVAYVWPFALWGYPRSPSLRRAVMLAGWHAHVLRADFNAPRLRSLGKGIAYKERLIAEHRRLQEEDRRRAERETLDQWRRLAAMLRESDTPRRPSGGLFRRR